MIGQNPALQSKAIVAVTDAFGAKLPTPVTDAYQRATRAINGLHSIYPKGGLAPLVAAALAEGRDPATDPDVMRADLAMRIGNHEITAAVENLVLEDMRQAFRSHADAIVKAWAKPYDQAAKTLTAAHSRLGDVALDNTAAIVSQGGDAAETWAKAQATVSTINAITDAWQQLAGLTRLLNLDPRYPALRLVTVTAETWRAQQLDRQRLTPWEAVTRGLTLSLPTMAEYRERVRNVERGLAELTAAEVPIDRAREHVRDWSNKVAAASRVA